jgi:quercetin dioxygenase-like cupin family protein
MSQAEHSKTPEAGEPAKQQASEANAKGQLAPAVASQAVNLVSYQEGAVVSRVLLRRDTGNVTLFAFDEGQELSEHTAPFDAMVHVLEGRVEIKIAGQPFELGAGEMILMPANQPHALRALSRFKMLLTMIRS